MSSFSPFKTIKIIDLSTVLAGPSVGSFFAELGAEVIKVENPNRKDITRSWKLPNEDKDTTVSAYFSSINYKKVYQSLDLKKEEDYIQLLALIKAADIVLMNYKKGDQEKLKIEDEVLRNDNPALIIGKISGFGQDSDRVAYDLILQAESGIMSMNGTPKSGPVKMPIALIDVLAAHHLKEGILIELLQRASQQNYRGKNVCVSLYDAAICSLVNQASNYLMTGHVAQRMGSLHPNIAPYGELFTTKDQKTITFAIGNNKHFELLCSFLGIDDLTKNDHFNTVQQRVKHREELAQILAPLLKEYTSNAIFDYMHHHFVPCGEVKNLKTVLDGEKAKELVCEELIDQQLTKRITGIAFHSSLKDTH